jgi:hypothetical protein
MARKGDCYIGYRNYGRDYKTLLEMIKRGVDFLVRLPVDAQWVECEQEKVGEADRQAGVKWAGTVKLGKEGKGPQVRIIEVLGQKEKIILATTLGSDEAAPELVAHIY